MMPGTMGSLPSWCYLMAKPFSPGGRSAYLESRALARTGVDAQRKAHLFSRGAAHRRQVAITFDDGPNPDVTPELLNILAEHKVSSTFFLIGREAISHVDLVRRLIVEGHEVGNHTMNHVKCSLESERELFRQIQDAQDAIRFASGKEASWFRPPYGDFDEAQLHLPFRSGLSTVYWTTKIRDWENDDADSIVRQVIAGMKPGGIFALHEKTDVVVKSLERILKAVRKAKLTPVTLSEMFSGEKPPYHS